MSRTTTFILTLLLFIPLLSAATLTTPTDEPVQTFESGIEGVPLVYTTGMLVLHTTPDASVTLIRLTTGSETSFTPGDLSGLCEGEACSIPLSIREATDLIVDESSARSVWRIVYDATPPRLTEWWVEDQQLILRAEDDTRIASVHVTFTTPDGDAVEEEGVFTHGTARIPLPTLPEGTPLNVHVVLQDAAGRTSTARFSFTLDTTPPVITLPAERGPYAQAGVRFTITDEQGVQPDSIRAWIDTTPVTPSCTGSRSVECTIQSSLIPQGTFTLRVEARDTLGNHAEEERVLESVRDTLPPIPLGMESSETFSGQPALGENLSILFDEEFSILPESVRIVITSDTGESLAVRADACTSVPEGVLCTLPLPRRVFSFTSPVRVTLTSALDTAGNAMPRDETLTQDFLVPLPSIPTRALLSDGETSIPITQRIIPVRRDAQYALILTFPELSVPPRVTISREANGIVENETFTPQDVRDACTVQAPEAYCTLGSIPGEAARVRVHVHMPGDAWQREVTLSPRASRDVLGSPSIIPGEPVPSAFVLDTPMSITLPLAIDEPGMLIGMEGLTCEEEHGVQLDALIEGGPQPALTLFLSPVPNPVTLRVTCHGRPIITRQYVTRTYEETSFSFTLRPWDEALPSPEEKAQRVLDQGAGFFSNPTVRRFVDVSKNLIAACEVKSLVSGVSSALDSLDAFLRAATGGTVNLKIVSDSVDAVDRFMREGPVIGEVCTFMTCQAEWQKKLAESFAPGRVLDEVFGTSLERDLSRLLTGRDEPLADAWESFVKNLSDDPYTREVYTQLLIQAPDEVGPDAYLVTSILTVCPKGIVKNLNRFIQSDCKYALCLERVASGEIGSVSVCERVHAYEQCMLWGREVEALMPQGLQGILTSLSDVIAHPIQSALKAALGKAVYEAIKSDDATTRALPKLLYELPYAWGEFTILIEIKNDLFSGDFAGAWNRLVEEEYGHDYCADIGLTR